MKTLTHLVGPTYLFVMSFHSFNYFKIEIFCDTYTIVTAMQQRVKEIFKKSFCLTLCCMSSFFRRVFGIYPKIGCYRLPTHRRGAHRKFF